MSTTFLIFAAFMVTLALLFLLLPLLRGKPSSAIVLILLISLPVSSWYGYQMIGNKAALDPQNLRQQAVMPQSMEAAIAMLKVKLTENPEDLGGWLLLGKSLLSTGHPDQAVTAYRSALTLEPDSAYIKMELGNAILSNSQPPIFPSEAKTLIQAAFAADPSLQKAQWLLGIAEASIGNNQLALDLWQDLLPKLEAGSGIAATVAEQIAEVESRLGIETTSVNVRLEISTSVTAKLTEQTVLFVFLRSAEQGGMPLAVKRIPAPQFPLEIKLTDASMLQAGKSLQDYPELLLSAKLSITGTADINADDLKAPAILIKPGNPGQFSLLLQNTIEE